MTQEELKTLLHYDPETGAFTWLSGNRLGKIAGAKHQKGYIRITIRPNQYYASRLAWFYMIGEWPSADIDHKDLNKSNNSWSNLRMATRSENMGNISHHSDNASGFKGVSFHKYRWVARISKDKKMYSLGRFKTKEEAAEAYARAAAELYGDFARM